MVNRRTSTLMIRLNLPSTGRLKDWPPLIKTRLRTLARQLYEHDMRWSYYAVAAMVAAGVVVNILLPYGWTVWPFVFVAGMMTMLHEAAERNGQGIPPLRVYGFVLGALAVWVGGAVFFSVINPLILLFGIGGILYQCARAWIRQRERDRLIAARREQGCCIFCGTPANPEIAFCENCGEEPDPDGTRLERVASVVRTRNNPEQARAQLTPKPRTATAAAREQALLARRQAALRRK